MKSKTKSQIIEIIEQKQFARVADLKKELGITSQALHRHLRDLLCLGAIVKVGTAPQTRYLLSDKPKTPIHLREELNELEHLFSLHPGIELVTLFGSQARGDATESSDIDLLVWIDPKSGFNRQDIWNYFDRHARNLSVKDKVSIVVRTLSDEVFIDTLLLDFPEEHVLLFSRNQLFEKIRDAVLKWRKVWGSKKLSSFGGTHGWLYSTKVKKLNEIDFRLELKNVA